MTLNELIVSSEEQTLKLSGGYSAKILFDPYYKRWYYNLYNGNAIVYAGIPLDPNTAPLAGFTDYYLGCVDKLANNEPYEPYDELGSRLGVIEVDNEGSSSI